MSDTVLFDFGSEENKKAIAEGANSFVIPDGKYHLQVVRSSWEENKNKDGHNWVMDFAVLEPGFENTKLRHWHVAKASNLWKTLPALEAIFQESWQDRQITAEDIKRAYGMKVIGIVITEPHYDATKAAAGQLKNTITDFMPDDGAFANATAMSMANPGEVGHPDYKPL